MSNTFDPRRLPHHPRLVEVGLPRGPLALWRPAGAEALLEELALRSPDPDDKMPYWADLWPAALGLAQALESGVVSASGKSTLELGCGLGLVSLAAARAGAKALATDWDADALAYVAASARENDLVLATELLDWRSPPALRFELILAADVLYEARNAMLLAHALNGLLAPEGEVWLSDPGRRFVPDFFRALPGWSVAATQLEVFGPEVPSGAAKIDLYRLSSP